MDYVKYIKGGIWWADIPFSDERGIIGGKHPVVIISNVSNPTSACQLTVCPISTLETAKRKGTTTELYAVPITVEHDSYVCCNQMIPFVSDKLFRYVGQCTNQKIDEIDAMIRKYLLLSLGVQVPQAAQVSANEVSDTAITTIHRKPRGGRRARKVRCINTDITYESVIQAITETGVSKSSIERSIRTGKPTKGLQFEYVKDENTEEIVNTNE